ncbi:MAG TPA: trypsin-like peptidase domain-containing protein [Thermoanaerobaculia bacterium]|nr:trypsin-like peptidase domain-containing protein [Thermoanaerobaculia bacterium]
MKRNLSMLAIAIACVAGGMVLTADLGWTQRSSAQTIQTAGGPVNAVTIPSFADVAERVMPSVVSITSTEVVKEDAQQPHGGQGVDPFDFFFPDPHKRRAPKGDDDDEHQQKSGGSGFIISPDGYILTNNHVIEGATRVEVHYGNSDNGSDRRVPAKIIGRDPATDIALLKIDVKEQLPAVRLGDSDRIRIGDWAIAIGNPLQFENTLTVGVISGRGRALGINRTTQSFENFIQTDAAINFGNSGGPLLNINGEVVGINTAIRAYAQNIGFATPINIAKRIYPQLKERGKVSRGYLGINITDVDSKKKDGLGLSEMKGAFVEFVVPGGPAEKGGIQPEDVIVQVDNKDVRKTRDLIDYVSDQPPGSSVRITLIRNGQRKNVTARTEERPATIGQAEEATPTEPKAPVRNKLGISVQEITPAVRQAYGIDDSVRGVAITDVKEVSPAGDAGLTEGDVITQANGQRVTGLDQFRGLVDSLKSGQYLRLYISRSTRGADRPASFFAYVQVP